MKLICPKTARNAIRVKRQSLLVLDRLTSYFCVSVKYIIFIYIFSLRPGENGRQEWGASPTWGPSARPAPGPGPVPRRGTAPRTRGWAAARRRWWRPSPSGRRTRSPSSEQCWIGNITQHFVLHKHQCQYLLWDLRFNPEWNRNINTICFVASLLQSIESDYKAVDAGVIAARGARQVTQASVWILNTKPVSLSETILNRDQADDFIMLFDPQ